MTRRKHRKGEAKELPPIIEKKERQEVGLDIQNAKEALENFYNLSRAAKLTADEHDLLLGYKDALSSFIEYYEQEAGPVAEGPLEETSQLQ
jgi:hypothetical protein